MKRKSMFIFGVTGVLALSIAFMTESESTEVLAKEQPKSESVQADFYIEDQIRVVTVEEQALRENKAIKGRDITTVITAEEHNMVENSSALSGFVSQENGPGFYFEKVK